MDKQKICKICSRRFANGKALGGHMRSHLAKLPVPAKPNPSPVPNNPTESIPKSTSSSSSPSNMQTHRSVNREFFDLVVHEEGGESEAESSKNLRKGLSKRHWKTIATIDAAASKSEQPDFVSSVTENISSDEDVAMFLVMLSRDKRPEKDTEVRKEKVNEYVEDVSEDEEKDASLSHRRALTSSEYNCKTCHKKFPSYQALGGHKASHKKMKKQREGCSAAGCGDVVLGRRIFQCPFCDKVFDSGQALGGHKKIHFSDLSVTKATAKSGKSLIDLNLPAPEDDSGVSL